MRRELFLSSLLLALLAGALCAGPARGATYRPSTAQPGSVPAGIDYQGQLLLNGIPVTSQSPWGVIFSIWDSAVGGTQIGPTMQTAVDIVSGLFSAKIPVTTDILVGGQQRWLEVEIYQPGQSPGSVPPLTPRAQLVSMPYALVAKAVEGTIDISTGALLVTTGASSNNAALYISSATAFIGIGTAHPYTLLTMSSGTLAIDGAGASLHLSSGPMAIDGAGTNLDVQGPAWFGSPGLQSDFDGAGTLHLSSPLLPQSGGTGQDFHAAAKGSIPYFSLAPSGMSLLGGGGAGTILQSNGTAPGWTAMTYPGSAGSVAQGDLLYGSAANAVSPLGIGTASKILRSNGTVPGWTAMTYPGSVAQGDLLYGSAANTVVPLGIGGASTILQSNSVSGVPAWTQASYPNSVAQGDLLYGSAANTVSSLAKSATPPRYGANTGGANSPAWDQVDLTNGVKNILNISSGGTGGNLSGAPAAQGSIPYFSAANVMTTLGPTTGGEILTTNGLNSNPTWTNIAAAGTAYTAISLAGGTQGSMPFQHAVGSTRMLTAVANGQLLMSQGPGADATWSNATYPLSTNINEILYSNAANMVTGLATQNSGVLATGGSGIPSIGTDIPTGVTIGGGTIYRVGGTKVGLAAGGIGADLSGVPTWSLIYKTAGPLAGTGVLAAGVLRGDGANVPIPLTGTAGYNAYWLTASTIAAEQYTPMSRGGLATSLAGVATGGLIYMGAGTLTGTGALTGVLKGNGAGAPSVATQDDLGDGATYKQYNPAAVAITGGRIGTATVLRLYNRTWAQLQATTPTAKGQMYFCTDCSPAKIAVSNGFGLGNFSNVQGGALP